MINKKGQFFIISAMIIIAVIISIATVSNYTSQKEERDFEHLKDEIKTESQYAIDSAVYTNLDEEQMTDLLENLAKNYVDYIGDEKNIYFLFGNQDQINFLGYQELEEEEVCIEIEYSPEIFPVEEKCDLIMNQQDSTSFDAPDDAVITKTTIIIKNEPAEEHNFELQEGQNFYFVVWKVIDEERHVITS